MKPYLRGILVILILATLCTGVQASNSDTLNPAKFALQFQMSGFDHFSSFQGNVISLRQYRQNKPDRRFGVSFTGNVDKRKYDREINYESDTADIERESPSKGISISLNAQQIYSLSERGPVTAYTAIGVFLPFSYSDYYQKVTYATPDTNFYKTRKPNYLSIGAGSRLNFGVEVQHNSWLYSFAEYGIRASLTWSRDRTIREVKETKPAPEKIDERTGYSFSIDPTYFTVGLGIKF